MKNKNINNAMLLTLSQGDNSSWLKELKTDGKGKFSDTIESYRLILSNDPMLKDCFAYNILTLRVENTVPLRWKTDLSCVNTTDKANILNYIEQVYFISNEKKFLKAFDIVTQNKKFHPVKKWLECLPEWDKKERIKTVLPSFFGCVDDEYTYQVFKKFMTAAVFRVMTPGCKWDYVPILCGKQGIMKSMFIRRLAYNEEWFSDNFLLSNVDNKQNIEQLFGNWIIEISELSGISKTDVAKLKSYITTRQDTVRLAYRSDPETFKRQCVFFGTTNEKEFLIDQTGNRRFLPLDCDIDKRTKDVYRDFTKDFIALLWAEAYWYYKQNESLFFDKNVNLTACLQQQKHEVFDGWEGDINFCVELFKKEQRSFTAADIYSRAFSTGNNRSSIRKDINPTVIRRINRILQKRDDITYGVIKLNGISQRGYRFI